MQPNIQHEISFPGNGILKDNLKKHPLNHNQGLNNFNSFFFNKFHKSTVHFYLLGRVVEGIFQFPSSPDAPFLLFRFGKRLYFRPNFQRPWRKTKYRPNRILPNRNGVNRVDVLFSWPPAKHHQAQIGFFPAQSYPYGIISA